MKTVLIDYAEEYYSNTAKIPVPDKRTGKFVQIRNDTTEHLIFSPKEFSPYHADIIERFCRQRGIAGVYNRAHKCFEIHEPEWVIIGGGKFDFDKKGKYIRLYDDSMAYGKFDSEGLLERILQVKGLRGYKVILE